MTTAYQRHQGRYACGAGHECLLACQPAEAAGTSTSCVVPASVTGAATGPKVIFPALTQGSGAGPGIATNVIMASVSMIMT